MATIEELLAGQVPTENDLLADNPWYMAGRQIQGIQAPQPQNNTQALLLPMLQGLAGGGLMGYGKGQAYEAGYDQYRNNPLLKAMVGSQPEGADLSTVPYASETMPEGWTPKVGKTDLLQALSAKQIADEAAAKKEDFKNQIEAQIAVKTDPRVLEAEGLKVKADVEKERTKGISKAEEDAYNRIEALPEAKQLADIAPNFKSAQQLVNKNDKASALAFISTIARIRDPQSVVREGEIKMNEDAQSYIQNLMGDYKAFVKGEAKLLPEARKQILESVKSKYNETGLAFKTRRDDILDKLIKKGGDPTNVAARDFTPLDMGEQKESTGGIPGVGQMFNGSKVKSVRRIS